MYVFILGGAQPQRPPPGFDGKVETPIRRGAWTSFLPHELSPPQHTQSSGSGLGIPISSVPHCPGRIHVLLVLRRCPYAARRSGANFIQEPYHKVRFSQYVVSIPNFINKNSPHGNTIWFVPRRASLFFLPPGRGVPAQQLAGIQPGALLGRGSWTPPPGCPYKGPALFLLPLSVRRPRWSVAVARVPIDARFRAPSIWFLCRHSLCNNHPLYAFGSFTFNSNLPGLSPPRPTTPSNASPSQSG